LASAETEFFVSNAGTRLPSIEEIIVVAFCWVSEKTLCRRSVVRSRLLHVGSRNTLLMKAALVHCIGLADEDVGRDFVFGAPKLSESRKKHQVIKCFGWERQTKRPRFRAVFGSRHGLHLTITTALLWHYNPCRANGIVERLIRRGSALPHQSGTRASGPAESRSAGHP